MLLVAGLVLARGARSGSSTRASSGSSLVGGGDADLRLRAARQRGLRGRVLRGRDRRHPARPRRRDRRLRRHGRRHRPDPAARAREPRRDRRHAVLACCRGSWSCAWSGGSATRNRRAERLVEELRESRAARAESAALAERGRVARELHDVLAHSLSALALQLEGTRLLARDRGADPEVIEGLERAHHLAVSGLTEARQAISALRGDDLPALEDLAGTFPNATFSVTGTPREPSSEARLALYRTAQEALTNVRRHSASDRVELKLVYEDDGTTLDRAGPRRRRAGDRRARLRADRHARARRAARRAPERRPDRRRLPGRAVASRSDPRPAGRRPARGPRGPRDARRPARRDRARGHRRRRRGGARARRRAQPRRRPDGPADAAHGRHRGDPPARRPRHAARSR